MALMNAGFACSISDPNEPSNQNGTVDTGEPDAGEPDGGAPDVDDDRRLCHRVGIGSENSVLTIGVTAYDHHGDHWNRRFHRPENGAAGP